VHILYGLEEIQDDLYSILLNLVASFQNGGSLNFWGEWKDPPDNVWTDWWIWLNFCMEVRHWRRRRSLQNGGRLNFWGGATFEPIGGIEWNFVWNDDIEDDLGSVLFNPAASTISKWWTFNPLRPSGNYMNYLLWQSVMLNFVFIGFAWFSLQTAIISLNSINQLIFVMVKCGVLFEVQTEFLNKM
jgi:hypothetical protein